MKKCREPIDKGVSENYIIVRKWVVFTYKNKSWTTNFKIDYGRARKMDEKKMMPIAGSIDLNG